MHDKPTFMGMQQHWYPSSRSVSAPHYIPLVSDDGVHWSIRLQLWCHGSITLLHEQQQGLMGTLVNCSHDGDEGAQGVGTRQSWTCEVGYKTHIKRDPEVFSSKSCFCLFKGGYTYHSLVPFQKPHLNSHWC